MAPFHLESGNASLLLAQDPPSTEVELTQYLLSLQKAAQQALRVNAAKDQEEKKQAILSYLKTHYDNPNLMIYDLCREFHSSESSLNKFFHDILGRSFSDLLESIRMEAACGLLRQGDLTIKAVADQTGYASDASFRRAFKRVMGISPSDYIRSRRGNPPEEAPQNSQDVTPDKP